MKKALLGKDWSKTLHIIVKAKIEYREDAYSVNNPSSVFNNTVYSQNGHRSSSAKPSNGNNSTAGNNPLAYSQDFSASKNSNSSPSKNRNSSSSGNKKNSVKNGVSNFNNRGSIYTIKDKNQKPEIIDEFGDVEKSFIDSIFNDEHVADFDAVDKTLNEFIEEFNKDRSEFYEETDETLLTEKAKNLIPKLFELQKIYYSQFNKANSTNKQLKELLIKYNEKYRTIVKKSNRLREALESNNIRNELTTFLNKEENKRVVNTLNLNRCELDTFKKLFKIDQSNVEMQKFKQNQNPNQAERDKGMLLSIIENICQNKNFAEKVPENKKIQFSYLISKYGIKVEDGSGSNNIAGGNNSGEKVNKIDLDDDDENEKIGSNNGNGKILLI